MFNNTVYPELTSFGSIINLAATSIGSVGIIFNVTVMMVLSRHFKHLKHPRKHVTRRVGLVHSINTYIHLIGILTTLTIMCIRTVYGDLNPEKRNENLVSWQCHFLSYLLSIFAAGVYGSCFLQALYRFWRIMRPNRSIYQNLTFHILLIISHFICIVFALLPGMLRSVYIISDHFCLSPFDDRWMAAYTSLTTVIIPVTGILIIYVKIMIHVKFHLQRRRRWKRLKRDICTIRRLLLLVVIILQTSSAGIVLWILTLFDERIHPVFYRLLRFVIILCMIIYSVTLLSVSPELKRALRSTKRQRSNSKFVTNTNTSLNTFVTIHQSEQQSIL